MTLPDPDEFVELMKRVRKKKRKQESDQGPSPVQRPSLSALAATIDPNKCDAHHRRGLGGQTL